MGTRARGHGMMRRHLIVLAVTFAALVAGAIVLAHTYPVPRDEMIPRHLENASFDPPPPAPPAGQFVATLWKDLWSESGEVFWRSMVPNQAGVLWLAVAVMLVVAFDYARPASARNFELLAMLAMG